MKIISLSSNIAGPACGIASSIKKYFYNGSKQTDMFDYLEISLLSIIQVLSLNNNDIELLSYNNTFLPNINNCQSVTFNNFDRMISHHDLKIDYTEEDYINFIDKYKRRYYRLIESIKTENMIFFIRYGEEDPVQYLEFIKCIKTINPLCNFYIINLMYDDNIGIGIGIGDNSNIYESLNIFNMYIINFYNYLERDVVYDDDLYFRMMQFNWKIVYELIYNHLFEGDKNQITYSK